MDLGKCPRCGKEWVAGEEICSQCGFIPIGAGLKAQVVAEPQNQRRRERGIELDMGLEREPGSRPGLILSALLLILVGVSYDRKIWVNEWETLRIMLGAPRSPEIIGEWGITTSEQLDKQGIDAKVQGLTGSFVFSKNGAARIHLYRGFQEMEATGLFSQTGTSIRLRNLDGSNGGVRLPDQVTLNVVWRHGSQMQIDIEGQERVTLQRQDS